VLEPRRAAFQPSALARADAAFALRAPYLFQRIGIALTLVDPSGWHAIKTMSNVVSFELEHGVELERASYNERCMAAAMRTRRAVLGEHAGFTDVFAPVCEGREVKQMLIAGPFLRKPSTAADLVARWRALTGRYAHTTDPEFARYAAQTFATIVLDDPKVELLKTLLERVADLASGRGNASSIMPQLEQMTTELTEAMLVPRMWDAARAMTDPSTPRTWSSPQLFDQRHELGLVRVPEHALVALMAGRNEGIDPVEELVQRDSFQRACVTLARDRGNVASGQIGNHGVMFLLAPERRDVDVRSRLASIAERATALARKFGFRLHVGTSSGARGGSLVANYHIALAAAEEALSRGLHLVRATGESQQPTPHLAEVRRKLAEADPRRPLDLAPRFERYLEVVGAHAGYRLETARHHLETGFERLSEPFLLRGALEARSASELGKAREAAANAARTVSELLTAYRQAVADLESALLRPAGTRREGNIKRAVAFIHEHLGEPLHLTEVARASGFAPTYFSRLFKQRERVTFEQYIQRLRAERAKQLLARTTLNVESVGRLCGFTSGPYFHRVFKQIVGETPRSYRKEAAIKFRPRSQRVEGHLPEPTSTRWSKRRTMRKRPSERRA
jgi:AraC-like DNA-binding protein